jgi:hypothetical protein
MLRQENPYLCVKLIYEVDVCKRLEKSASAANKYRLYVTPMAALCFVGMRTKIGLRGARELCDVLST